MGGDLAVPAVDAHQLARISYRQLDHWARQGWVAPSADPGRGRSGRRLYVPADVVRLDLLRHLAVSGVTMAVVGPVVAAFDVPDGDVRVLWGPVGAKDADDVALDAVWADEVLARLERCGAYVVYNPAGVRQRLAVVADQLSRPAEPVAGRRRQSA